MKETSLDHLFEQLGLTPKEIQTFMKLLELGAQPVSVVAKYVGLPRSSMYFTLDKLKEIGLVEEFERSGVKYMRCVSLEDVGGVFERRQRQLQAALEEFQERLPQFAAIANTLSVAPTVRFIEGVEAVRRMYLQEQTQVNKDWRALYNPDVLRQIVPEMFEQKNYHGDKGQIREVLVDSPVARTWRDTCKIDPTMFVKLLPEAVTFETDISVSEDRIYMMSVKEDQAAGIAIVHPQMAHQMRMLFDMLWASLPD